MGKSKKLDDFDTEYFAFLDQLRSDYSEAQETIASQRKDILTLVSLLISNDIAMPTYIVDKYIRKIEESVNLTDEDEELPFN